MKVNKASILVALVIASGSAVAGNADFKLVNRTGYAIDQVYISPSKSSKWGSDRLGSYQLENGASKTFAFSDSAHCHQDIKVIYDDKSEVEWSDVNLCELDKVVLHYNKDTDTTSYTSE